MKRLAIKFKTKISASDSAMRLHRKEAEKYRKYIQEACSLYNFQDSVIAGIGSRESGWGLFLKPKGPIGTGDFTPRGRLSGYRNTVLPTDGLGFGRGLMQIDYDYHEFARTGNWRDPRENILYGTKLLCGNKNIKKKRTIYSGDELLRAVIASYNAGPGGIIKACKRGLNIDHFTTGGDYSKDVLNRAGYFQLFGWE